MPDKRKVDRRVQRTRAMLRDALMRLIIRKGYDEITIQDITDEANVARTTFYLHFADKDELLFGTMRDIYEDLVIAMDEETSDAYLYATEEDCNAEDFIHVQQYSDFYKIMMGERGSAAFLTRVREYLANAIMGITLKDAVPAGRDSRLPIDMMAYAIAGAQIGVIKWWLDNDMRETPREVAYMLQELMRHGIIWGLNIDEG